MAGSVPRTACQLWPCAWACMVARHLQFCLPLFLVIFTGSGQHPGLQLEGCSLHCPFSSLTSMADNKLHSSSYPGVHIWRHPISCCHVGLESWLFKISFSPNRDGPRPPVYTLEKVREIELLAVISKSKTTYSFLPCLNLYLDNRSLR